MKFSNNNLSLILGFIIFFVGIIYTAYIPEQQDFLEILLPLTCSFLVYFHVIFKKKPTFKLELKPMLYAVFLVKFILVFSFPNLSDDIYRFAWDGHLVRSGISPYGYLPGELINAGIDGVNQELYDQLNSPNYYSVYPPINQFFFWIVSSLSFNNITIFSIITKIIIFLADVLAAFGLFKLLDYFKMDRSKSLIYLMNPLLILELNGNLHFEGVMISLFIWALVLFYRERIIIATLLLSLSIGVKLVPIFFIPLFIKYFWKHPKIYVFITSLIIFGVIIGSPLLFGIQWRNFGQSIDLYFQKFEFNASNYYLLRWLGKIITGYNQIWIIGPILGFTSLIVVLFISWKKSILNLVDIAKYALIALSVYYFNTTTVHPWYMSFLLVLSVFTSWRYAIIWSYMILLSYTHYIGGTYIERFYMITIEYVIVGIVVIGDFQYRAKKSRILKK